MQTRDSYASSRSSNGRFTEPKGFFRLLIRVKTTRKPLLVETGTGSRQETYREPSTDGHFPPRFRGLSSI